MLVVETDCHSEARSLTKAPGCPLPGIYRLLSKRLGPARRTRGGCPGSQSRRGQSKGGHGKSAGLEAQAPRDKACHRQVARGRGQPSLGPATGLAAGLAGYSRRVAGWTIEGGPADRRRPGNA